ncbi:hypothetical protein [Geodermatophilus chilensis]|jgi:hypothetical protein|uniref:hypothetical protein n=1 Tax=Geodermatophilus chilensis TaxID=2035835 RepID=UPI000C265D40|nr:hypothetical protein [Geodermatophilus chilensis]
MTIQQTRPGPAWLDPGERHIRTWRVDTLQQVREGGFFLKITVWEPNGVWDLHLTDRRLVLEPVQRSAAQKWGERAAIAATGALLGAAGMSAPGVTSAASASAKRATAASDQAGGTIFEAPLAGITGVDRFSHGNRQMLRITTVDMPDGRFVLGLHGGMGPMSRSGIDELGQAIGDACRAL